MFAPHLTPTVCGVCTSPLGNVLEQVAGAILDAQAAGNTNASFHSLLVGLPVCCKFTAMASLDSLENIAQHRRLAAEPRFAENQFTGKDKASAKRGIAPPQHIGKYKAIALRHEQGLLPGAFLENFSRFSYMDDATADLGLYVKGKTYSVEISNDDALLSSGRLAGNLGFQTQERCDSQKLGRYPPPSPATEHRLVRSTKVLTVDYLDKRNIDYNNCVCRMIVGSLKYEVRRESNETPEKWGTEWVKNHRALGFFPVTERGLPFEIMNAHYIPRLRARKGHSRFVVVNTDYGVEVTATEMSGTKEHMFCMKAVITKADFSVYLCQQPKGPSVFYRSIVPENSNDLDPEIDEAIGHLDEYEDKDDDEDRGGLEDGGDAEMIGISEDEDQGGLEGGGDMEMIYISEDEDQGGLEGGEGADKMLDIDETVAVGGIEDGINIRDLLLYLMPRLHLDPTVA